VPTIADTRAGLRDHVEGILHLLGEDVERDGLRETPDRFARALEHLTQGYREDPVRMLRGALFPSDTDEMVIVKEIDFFSLCQHHLLPFFGKCHVAYLPNGRIVGLSKIARLVDLFARRLQVQERLTQQIAGELRRALRPKGVGVVMDAYHLCMMMRGVEKRHAHAVTSSMVGRFRRDPRTREEFLQLIRVTAPI
jgi:GTP cyclohydrolase I